MGVSIVRGFGPVAQVLWTEDRVSSGFVGFTKTS